MNKMVRATLVLVFNIFMLGEAAQARNDFVRVTFEQDGKKVEQKFKILIYDGNDIIEPLRFENGFVVPPEIRTLKRVDVRIIFSKYNILFEEISLPKFETDWIVGVDNKPFDTENSSLEDAKKMQIMYYITFDSKTGDSIRVVIKVHKKTKQARQR